MERHHWSLDELRELKGKNVLGTEGQPLGKVAQVYCDIETREPEWIRVSVGPLGAQKRVVPMDRAILHDGQIVVPYDADTVKHEPHARIRDDEIVPEDEQALCRYFGIRSHPSGQDHRSILYI